MRSRRRIAAAIGTALVATLALAGCGAGNGPGSKTGRGPITIWYSNNEQEVTWGKQMVSAWNSAHPDQKVTAQEIPAGSSSEAVIGAAIAAGNSPCLIYNTAPVAVGQFEKQGGLVDLSSFPGGASYIEKRSGDVADQYRNADGDYYQLPWKSNPVMIFYNKKIFQKAGISDPDLSTYDGFLAASRQIVKSGAAKYAIYPSPTSQYYQSFFDFYPLYAAESGGTPMVKDDKATFDDAAGDRVADFWHTIYAENLAGKEVYQGDAFADGTAAMAIVGPWAVAVYQDVDWAAVPVPTSEGLPESKTYTFSDAKNIGLFTACQNQATAWDVAKFSTSMKQDGKLLDLTGQMPLRTDVAATYADYFSAHPAYSLFGRQVARVVEAPNNPNAIAMVQRFRDAWSGSVIFGSGSPSDALKGAASTMDTLAAQP